MPDDIAASDFTAPDNGAMRFAKDCSVLNHLHRVLTLCAAPLITDQIGLLNQRISILTRAGD